MNRMIDRHPELAMFNEMPQTIRKKFAAVDITNVSDWFFADSPKTDWDIETDFPCIVSPWMIAWYESQMPNAINENGFVRKCLFRGRYGIAVLSIPVPEKFRDDCIREDFLWSLAITGLRTGQKLDSKRGKYEDSSVIGKRAGWLQTAMISLEPHDHRKPIWMGTCLDYLDEDGKVIGGATRWIGAGNDSLRALLMRDGGHQFVLALYFAISLLHCKNVTTREETEHHGIAGRQYLPQGCGARFKTLEIGPFKSRAESETGTRKEKISKALHLCRGHFKQFTEENPLFGKYVGTFWWAMHMRGDAKYGEVVKDYKVVL